MHYSIFCGGNNPHCPINWDFFADNQTSSTNSKSSRAIKREKESDKSHFPKLHKVTAKKKSFHHLTILSMIKSQQNNTQSALELEKNGSLDDELDDLDDNIDELEVWVKYRFCFFSYFIISIILGKWRFIF